MEGIIDGSLSILVERQRFDRILLHLILYEFFFTVLLAVEVV